MQAARQQSMVSTATSAFLLAAIAERIITRRNFGNERC